jgi:hypothetical protein
MMVLTENSDDAIFAHLNMARHLEDIARKPLSGTNKSLPLIIVRDEAFPTSNLRPHILLCNLTMIQEDVLKIIN